MSLSFVRCGEPKMEMIRDEKKQGHTQEKKSRKTWFAQSQNLAKRNSRLSLNNDLQYQSTFVIYCAAGELKCMLGVGQPLESMRDHVV